MYREINCDQWIDPRVRSLSAHAKLLYVYLQSNTHSHVSGLYHHPIPYMSHEIGLAEDSIESALEELAKEGLCEYDIRFEVVWVIDMLRDSKYTPLEHGGITAGVRQQAERFKRSELSKRFVKSYRSWFRVSAETRSRLRRDSGESPGSLISKDKGSKAKRQRPKDKAFVREELGGVGGREELSTGHGHVSPPAKAKKCGSCDRPADPEVGNGNFCARCHAESMELERARQRALVAAAEARALMEKGSDGTAAPEGVGTDPAGVADRPLQAWGSARSG